MFLNKGKMWWKGNKDEVLTTDNKEMLDFIYASEFMKQLMPKKN